MTTPPAKLYNLSEYHSKYVRMSVIEDMARNLRAVQDYLEEHAADFQGDSDIYVKEYIDDLVSDFDEILHPSLELKEAV